MSEKSEKTKNPERSLEEIEQELALVQQSERELTEEQGRSNDTLRKAAQEAREALGSSSGSGSSRSFRSSSPLDKARKRVEELPLLVWDVRIRSLELTLERITFLRDEADRARLAASEEAYRLEEEMKRLEEQIAPLRDTMHTANASAKEYRQHAWQTERELAALKARGPEQLANGGAGQAAPRTHGAPFGRPG